MNDVCRSSRGAHARAHGPWSAAILLSLLAAAYTEAVSAQSRANFILFLTDDQGWTATSAPMSERYPTARSDYHRTPHLESLVARGMRFSHSYSASPVCSPNRMSLQLGRSPAALGYTENDFSSDRIRPDDVTLPRALEAVDPAYRTAHLGKWHIPAHPDVVGFDVHDGRTDNAEGGFAPREIRFTVHEVDPDPKRIVSLTNRAIEFMEASVEEERPFLLQLSHYAVHASFETTADRLAFYEGRPPGDVHRHAAFAAMTEELDASLGRVVEAVDRLGLSDDTYIFYLSDNGAVAHLPPWERSGPFLNDPLREGKWSLMEGGIRIPWVVAGPGVPPGSESEMPVVTYDILPTILDLADPDAPFPGALDGGSFGRILHGVNEASIDRSVEGIVFHYPHRTGEISLGREHSAIRSGALKLLLYHDTREHELFDVVADLGETRDLSRTRAADAVALRETLETYLDDVDAVRTESDAARGTTRWLALAGCAALLLIVLMVRRRRSGDAPPNP